MKTLKLITLLMILVTAIGFNFTIGGSTGKIAGAVLDKEDNSPIPAASVLIEGTVIGAKANPVDGKYLIENVPPGKYTLIASCLGYHNIKVENVVVHADLTTEINFLMISKAIDMGEIVVEAKAPIIDKFETSSVSRLSQQDIESLPSSSVQGITHRKGGVISEGDALHVRGSRPGELEFVDDGVMIRDQLGGYGSINQSGNSATPTSKISMCMPASGWNTGWNTESYSRIVENEYKDALTNPLSTFSIDVDAASYSNIRRFINGGSLPPTDAVRLEEMVNYFDYDYPQPADDLPFSIITEISECPWNGDHRLIHIGLQGREVETENLPPSNLVFLIDVSGSMDSPDKLPLLKTSFKLLVDKLRPEDRVAIVTYAGRAGLLLESTPGNEKEKIKQAISSLGAGGCTAGAQGILTAYEIAKRYYQKGGNNRVILATDGDFNIGVSSDAEMTELIEHKRKEGVFLTVLGFGTGNVKDSKMEILADKGNGNYAYIDNIREAQKVLVNEMGATLFTIAKDVKIQIEFNPVRVKAYRLVGYENRLLAKEDFEDDTKDAGELGAGHTVTAMYEVIPAGSDEDVRLAGDLKYQVTKLNKDAYHSHELMTVKLRYKEPDGDRSKLIEQVALDQNTRLQRTSDNFRFSAAVAEWGLLLRDSKFKGDGSYDRVLEMAKGAKGDDKEGYRAEFINLVESSKLLAGSLADN